MYETYDLNDFTALGKRQAQRRAIHKWCGLILSLIIFGAAVLLIGVKL